MHSRRARPTLRLLTEDLVDGWASPHPRRLLNDRRLIELHPLSELPHPIISKAAEAFGHDQATDNHAGPISSSARLPLLEIKSGQWRGGVWLDVETGVHWLVTAGLAKGNHLDRDDFYQCVKRADKRRETHRWLPTDEDRRLLKQETAARLLTEWELTVQRQVLQGLREIHAGGTIRLDVHHPVSANRHLATVDLAITEVRESGYQADEVELTVTSDCGYAGSNLIWQLTTRALITVSPPEQGWDRYRDSYSTIADPGYFSARVQELDLLDTHNQLTESEPGQHAHYAHRQHLAGSTINGHAVRALCGSYSVPTQDHASLPECPICRERIDAFPL
ncbi:MAG: DUF3039 domain-containing protein [Nigerium sp.]|nr:DUF3039 domain-containing protein [Nigerium sp.]